MFKLLSKESNIFSIPVYIIFLLFIVIGFNVMNISFLNGVSSTVLFFGVALAYFAFIQIDLNHHTHLPLFLYTFFIFALYPGNLDIGLAVSLFTNAFILMVLSAPERKFKENSYVLIGSFLAINYIFLPTTWPMFFFVLLHAIATSRNVGLGIFRLIFGLVLIFSSYFCVAYFLDFDSFNEDYFSFTLGKLMNDFSSLYSLIPILALLIYAVIDHFKHYNEKSPDSRFKYTFMLTFTLAQMVTIVLYMGNHYEYLLLLAFPASVILSRALYFLPRYWMKELGVLLIIICLLIFKLEQYSIFF